MAPAFFNHRKPKHKPSNLNSSKTSVMKNQQKDNNITITKPGKAKRVVIVNKYDYIEITEEILKDKSRLKPLTED